VDETLESPSQKSIPFWRDDRVLRIAAQILAALVVLGLLGWAINNVLTTAQQRGLSLGFRFLQEAAGFPISESPIPYDPSRTFAYAFWVGTLNTLKVSVIGILLSTLIGTLIGIARLSSNWLVSKLALVFIEFHRNIPLLVLLLIWYLGVFTKLPRVQNSFLWFGTIFLNQRGLYLPAPHTTEAGKAFWITAAVGLILALATFIWLRQVRIKRGRQTYYGATSTGIFVAGLILGWIFSAGKPFTWEIPVLSGFNFRGGLQTSPEFTALLIGLVLYTAAFIAEVVRAGIQAVSLGQHEAARALGLRGGHILRLVVFPQALRVIIPPLISQYLNLLKNSSLAIFIGFPELFFIGKTTSNQAGRALQVFLLVIAVYLVISLFTSVLMNWYNRRIQLMER
jgi:general L-amino acid transport system permease protein